MFRSPRKSFSLIHLALGVAVAFSLSPATAWASFHAINVSEVYTNPQGNVQYVELKALGAGQTQLQFTRLVAWNADSTSQVLLFDFTVSFPALDFNETILLATAAFQDTAGFAPDFVIPDSVFVPDGRIGFNRDSGSPVLVDGVAYGAYTGANVGFGTPAQALPTNGTLSLTRTISGLANRNNSIDWQWLQNSPKRNDGTTTTLPGVSGVDPGLPRQILVLEQNRPNPSSGATSIPFALDHASTVTLRVFGVDGRLIRTVDAGRFSAGPHALTWDGRDEKNLRAPGGVYVYRLTADGAAASRQMLLVR